MSTFLWLLDNGHGGLIDGLYQTPGKRSPRWRDGTILYEGEFNRAIVARLVERLTADGIRYVNLTPEYADVSLPERVQRANAFHGQAACILVSVHANAGGGRGYEVYTSRGDTQADDVASVFFDKFKAAFPEARMRADLLDGDTDKEANFYMLRHTRMPAILTENFFMDNEEECRTYLMTAEGRDRIAGAHYDAIAHLEAHGL